MEERTKVVKRVNKNNKRERKQNEERIPRDVVLADERQVAVYCDVARDGEERGREQAKLSNYYAHIYMCQV